MPNAFLLGRPHYKSDNGAILETNLRRKTRAVLAYMCLTNEPLSREHLANMFCRNSNDPHGSLRWHISRIRRNFHESALISNDDEIRINQSSLWVDARAFLDQVERTKRSFDVEAVEKTLQLYRGEVLSGYSLPGETDFELWLLGQRAHYAQLYEKLALSLIQRCAETADYQKALDWAKTLLNHNSILEEAHYWLMWLYTRTGQAHIALQQYDVYQNHMMREFGTDASERITELQRQIRDNDLPTVTANEVPIINGRPPVQQTPFVGRNPQLQQLRTHWEMTARGCGSAVVIQGDAGVGKSALVRQFVQSLPRHVVLYTSSGYESTMTSTLALWINIVRECFQAFAADDLTKIPRVIQNRLSLLVPDLIPFDSDKRDVSGTDNLSVELLLNTIVDFFSLLASEQPFVVIIEDFHFADEHSIQLLSLLLNRLKSISLLLLITQRSTEASENPYLQVASREWQSIDTFEHISLERLDSQHVLELIDHFIPEIENREAFCQKLIDHTLGVSLHILEVLHACKTEPHLLDELPVPLGFTTLVLQRLHKMSDGQRQLLETLAIIEYPASLSELLECIAQNEIEAIQNLEYTMKHRLIKYVQQKNRITYEFTHFLYRDVILSHMAEARKQLLHRRVSQLLQKQATILLESNRPEIVIRIVHHARCADDVASLIRWIPIAAETARNTFAYRHALELYEILDAALQQTPLISRDEYMRILLNMVELIRFLGDWKSQERILQRIEAWHKAEPISDRELLLSFLVEYGTNLFRSGKYEDASDYLKQTITLGTAAGNNLVVAQAHGSLGNIAYVQSDWDAAEEQHTRAIRLRELSGDDIGVGKGYNNLGAIAYHRGNYEQAADYYQKNMEIREKHQDLHGIATALNNLGTVYMTLGQWDDATDQYQRALEIRRKLDDQHGIASTLDNLAQIRGLQDCFPEAIAYHQESLSIREAINDRAGVAHSLAALGEVYIDQQDYDTAVLHLQQSLNIYQQLENKLGMVESMSNLSFARALQDSAIPDTMFFEAMQIAYDLDSNQLMCTALEKLAWLSIQANDLSRAACYVGLVDAQKRDQRRSLVNDIKSVLRTSLDDEYLHREMQQGSQMNVKQVVAELLSEHVN